MDCRLPSVLKEALARVRSVGVITGAGISAESGIPTYRGKGGIYDDPEEGDRTIEALLVAVESVHVLHRRRIALERQFVAQLDHQIPGRMKHDTPAATRVRPSDTIVKASRSTGSVGSSIVSSGLWTLSKRPRAIRNSGSKSITGE